MRLKDALLYAAIVWLYCPTKSADDHGEALFDGVSMKGWKAMDMSYWTIEDGAITATASEANPCQTNQFLVWQGGDIADFSLTLEFRLEGGPKANSGIQVRSEMDETGHAKGYQVDISPPDAPWLGAIYDEHGRKMLAARGESTVIQSSGNLEKTAVDSAIDAITSFQTGEWNTYEIVAKGSRIEVSLNGHITSIIEDLQEEERELSGVLALQLHSGPPMKIQFKDIFLKKW